MTDDAWFGVTHESVAKYVAFAVCNLKLTRRSTIAQHMAEAAPPNRSIIIDAFCGVGGNTIAFALSGKWKRVYAIEKDSKTLECAKHNAEIYGVADKITWFHGDCFEILGAVESTNNTVTALQAIASTFGVIFGSPPWGGSWRFDRQYRCLTNPLNRARLQERRSLRPRNNGAIQFPLSLRVFQEGDSKHGVVLATDE